jgi:hypothetical protein
MHRLLKRLTREEEDKEDKKSLDVSQLLEESADKPDLEYLQKTVWKNGKPIRQTKTLEDINREVLDVIRRCAPPHQHKDLYDKLVGYRVVHELPELHVAKAVKILKPKNDDRKTLRLQQMGIVLNIKFFDNGTHIICRMPPRAVIQFKYNEAIAVFQKLSDDECMLLYLDRDITLTH